MDETKTEVKTVENSTASPAVDLCENESDNEDVTQAEIESHNAEIIEPPDAAEPATGGSHEQSQTPQASSSCEGLKLKIGQVVKYINNESGQSQTGKVLSRAGKATGKHKDWYNLQFIQPEELAGTSRSVNLGIMDSVQVIPSESEECTSKGEDVFVVHDDVFVSAKHAELINWKKNDVFEEVTDEGQKCVSTRWVCTLKETAAGVVPKARLVARGFEE